MGRLHEELDPRRQQLLSAREERQAELDAGGTLSFVTAPEDFTVAPVPDALQDRRVEITGPATRKMVINALNSGARAFMADFEDSNSPTWSNMIGGQVNLADAARGSMEHEEDDKQYRLEDDHAVLLVRPRGLHLPERHMRIDGRDALRARSSTSASICTAAPRRCSSAVADPSSTSPSSNPPPRPRSGATPS